MDSNVNKILQNIVNTATLAADEAKAAVHSAGKAVAGKYDEVKMNIELARLSDEQEDVFSDIGRMLFLMHTGAVKDTVMSDEGEKSPQQVIDALLVSAEQVQQEMDVITDKLTVLDAQWLDLSLIPEGLREVVAPLVLNALASEYCLQMSYLLGHPMSSRRYMGVEKY